MKDSATARHVSYQFVMRQGAHGRHENRDVGATGRRPYLRGNRTGPPGGTRAACAARRPHLLPLPQGEGGTHRGRFSMDGVPTRSVGTGFCLSVGTCSASRCPADAQKRVPTEKTYPCEEGGQGGEGVWFCAVGATCSRTRQMRGLRLIVIDLSSTIGVVFLCTMRWCRYTLK